ncbi:DNA invertase Pin-like site-specific DNA recombinase [Microbacterium keratanolyticum]|uniref:Serine recombinase n=1 Tax=Microbacterium keratanolyticum TaxID=67574 RepID=A0A9W6HRU5_9MICO|nr:recombinase family protein [Microbacterium keratanolyticum]MBM7469159.1 DNA invertase Pin-like site-specific DNA recombinase [Microbacterium keratanolyticum]GLK01240.1 serine recombinase [Microbacterium keratanolyticum]
MTKAAIYTRISLDTEGEALGVARQEQDCRDLAARDGLDVVAVFSDNDTGASTRSRKKTRPQYTDMLSRARTGEFGVIIAYSNSRLTRRPLELEELITLYEQHGVRITTVVSGNDDLTTADGRMVARIKGNVDAAEAERTAERVARKHLESAREGRPVAGTRPFGWQPGGRELDAKEAKLIRDAAADIIAGIGTYAIARRWNDAGVTTSTGRPWQGHVLGRMMKSPRLAGWRIHQGQVAIGRDGQPVRGQWEPILDQATHDALVIALSPADTRSRVPRKNARHYLMTGTLRCGVCGAVMYGNAAKYPAYRCAATDHTVAASTVAVDDLVTAVVLAKLADVELDTPKPEFTDSDRLAEVEASIASLMASFTAHELSAEVVFPAVSRLEKERDQLRAERRRIQAAEAAPDLSSVDRARWAKMSMDARRGVVESLLGAVLVRPATRGGNRFDPDRVEFVWR